MRTRPLVLTVALALLIGGAAWLLWEDAPDGGPPPDLGGQQAGGAGTTLPEGGRALPHVEGGEVEPLAVGEGTGSGTDVVTIGNAFDGGRQSWTGRIVDADGRPLPGADVWLVTPNRLLSGWPAPEGLRVASFSGKRRSALTADVRNALDLDHELDEQAHTRTDDDGRFTIDAVDRARDPDDPTWPRHPVWWMLVVTAPSYASRTIELPLGPRDVFPMLDIGLEPEVLVRGVVLDADGLPVHDAFVCPRFGFYQPLRLSEAAGVSRVLFEQLSGTRTDRDGTFELHGLWSGDLSLVVEHPDHPTLARSDIELVAGEVKELELTLLRGAALSGLVVDPDGAPIAGASVVALAPDEDVGSDWRAAQEAAAQRLPVARTDTEGRFLLGNAPDRVNDVLAWAEGCEPSRQADVPAGANTLRLQLEREQVLLVCCVDGATGQLLAEAELSAYRGDDQRAALPVDDVGGPDATHRVRGAGAVESTLVRATHPGYQQASRSLQAGDVGETVLELALAPAGVVSGEARSTDGRRVAGARVMARQADDAQETPRTQRAMSDETGRFVHDELAPGTWSLWAVAAGFATAPSRTLTVAAGDHLEEVVVELLPEASVSGQVLNGGTPLPWPELLTFESVGGEAWSTDTTTDGLGRFHFGGLLAGRYRLSAPALGLPGTSVEVTLATGEARVMTLDLPARPVVYGRVRAADAGIVVHAYPVDTTYGRPHAVATDDTGLYRLHLPGPGTWAVTADRPGTVARLDPPVHAREVTVSWNEQHPLELELGGDD